MSIRTEVAMQTIHPASETGTRNTVEQAPSQTGNTEKTRIYAQEVRSLRQRVAVLEAELAAAKAAEQLSKTPPLTSIDFAPPVVAPAAPTPVLSHRVVAACESTSRFSQEIAPAVVAANPEAPAEPAQHAEAAPADTEQADEEEAESAELESNPGFAEAWGQEPDATFAEKVAEKAFFQATSIDEQSRSWLLDS